MTWGSTRQDMCQTAETQQGQVLPQTLCCSPPTQTYVDDPPGMPIKAKLLNRSMCKVVMMGNACNGNS